jgi:cellulose synthase (UDP-forming)
MSIDVGLSQDSVSVHTGSGEALAPALAERPVSAPSDREVYYYFGPQKRWVSLFMTTAFALAAYSLFKFSLNSAWLLPILVVLAINVFGSILSMLSGLHRRRIDRADHEALIASWHPEVAPSVDVFLPTCGEPLEILANTYDHVAALRWGGQLTVLVLDDGDRAEVRELAASYGFRYEVRPDRGRMKKAGNLRHGYGVTDGEHIAIFDADFCPRADYLFHLIPYLDEPDVGIVQSPQAFDASRQMGWLQRTAGATQELFYRWVQPSRDRAGAPICVGTNAIYRRAALTDVGGFAQIEHSEDVHTGITLLRGGWSTRYVPIVVAKGLCPDDLAGFLNQQYRWCNGSITLLKSGEAHRRPLKLRQRMCFWAGFMYYIGTAVNVFVVHLPGTVMAFFYPEEVRAAHYVPFMVGAWVYLVLLPSVFKSHWRFEVLRVQMAYSFSHTVALVHKVTGRSAGWVPTGAVSASSHLARTIAKVGLVTLTVTMAASWAGVLYAVPRFGLAEFWPMILFNIGYTYLALPLALDFQRLLTAGRAANRTPATAAADAIVTVDVRQSDVRGLVPAARALLEGGAA